MNSRELFRARLLEPPAGALLLFLKIFLRMVYCCSHVRICELRSAFIE